MKTKVIVRSWYLGPSQEAPTDFMAVTAISEGDPSAFHRTVASTAKQTDRYTCPATLGVTIVPSGSTTTKNCFIGLVIRDCSERSLAMRKSPPNQIRCRTRGIATRIAATIKDSRNKTILYKVVRLTVQIGCMTDCDPTWLPIFISLNMRLTRSDDRNGLL